MVTAYLIQNSTRKEILFNELWKGKLHRFCIVDLQYKALQRMFHTRSFVSKQKETNNKGNGPICRKDVWSPLLNAFNQVRRPCSTFYASIDSGHAYHHRIKGIPQMVSSLIMIHVKITHLKILKLNMIWMFFLIAVAKVTPAIVGKVKTDMVCYPTRYLSFILGPLYRYNSPSR